MTEDYIHNRGTPLQSIERWPGNNSFSEDSNSQVETKRDGEKTDSMNLMCRPTQII